MRNVANPLALFNEMMCLTDFAEARKLRCSSQLHTRNPNADPGTRLFREAATSRAQFIR